MHRKGRLPGSKNRDWTEVGQIPARCPSCLSTEREILRIAAAEDFSGMLDNGIIYDRVVWRNVRCRACGQFYRVRTYEFSGQTAKSPKMTQAEMQG